MFRPWPGKRREFRNQKPEKRQKPGLQNPLPPRGGGPGWGGEAYQQPITGNPSLPRTLNPAGGLINQGFKKGARKGVIQGFRVPLHGHGKTVARAFQRLDYPVGCGSRNNKSRRRGGGSLVMETVHSNNPSPAKAGQACQPGGGADRDRM